MSVHNIVIVGGGAAGLALASRLGRKFRRDDDTVVTLVDRELTHIWKPLLHEVAAGTFDSHVNEVSFLAQARRCNFRFRLGTLDHIDRERQRVSLSSIASDDDSVLVPERELDYDTLVVAIGSVSNDFGVSGVAEHCLFLDTTQQAERFHRQLVQAYLGAYAGGPASHEDGKLRIAIIGAGATGVELAAQLHEVSELLSSYVDYIVEPAQVHITIIEGAERILPALPEYLSAATAAQLEALGVELLTGEIVSEVDAQSVRTRSGKKIKSDLNVWAAGIKAPAALQHSEDLERSPINQLKVRATLQTTLDDNIFAIGDCAACEWTDGKMIPPRAQSAHQQATLLARNIPRRLAGQPLRDFHYRDYGSLVSLGGYTTVGNMMGSLLREVRIEGLIARLVYLSLYKMHQVSLFGFFRTLMLSVSNIFRRSVHPAIKLH